MWLLHLKDILLNLELPIPCKRRIIYTAFKVKDIRAGKRLHLKDKIS
jgi:hypothetical protein